MKTKPKTIPTLRSDKQAEQLVQSADLSQYDLSGFKPMRFELEPESAALNIRILQKLLDALKQKASQQGIPYTRYIRHLLESTSERGDILHLAFDPASGREMKGKHFCMVMSPPVL